MNACCLISCSLLAQIHRFDGLRDRFSGPRSRFGMDDAITAILAILGVSVVLYLVNRWHSRRSGKQSYNSPSAMFHELCQAHNLDRKTRQLLKRVAQWQGLTHPARLFLEPERYEPANLSPELERFSAELFELRAKLFTFDVRAESRDSLHHHSDDSSQEMVLDAEMRPVPQPEVRTEAIGAAAFATTRLESTISHSES
jgi:hypothetical protein